LTRTRLTWDFSVTLVEGDVAVSDRVEAEVGGLVAVVVGGLDDRRGMTGTGPVLDHRECLALDRWKVVQPAGALGQPVAGLELHHRTAGPGEFGHHRLVPLAVVPLPAKPGHHVGPLLGLLHRCRDEQLDRLGVVPELGHHGSLVQGQVVASGHLGGDVAAGHDECLAHLRGLDTGHGGDVLLGHAVEAGQLLDDHGLLDRSEVVPSDVLDQHPGHLVNR
jgi:hypothetical protein